MIEINLSYINSFIIAILFIIVIYLLIDKFISKDNFGSTSNTDEQVMSFDDDGNFSLFNTFDYKTTITNNIQSSIDSNINSKISSAISSNNTNIVDPIPNKSWILNNYNTTDYSTLTTINSSSSGEYFYIKISWPYGNNQQFEFSTFQGGRPFKNSFIAVDEQNQKIYGIKNLKSGSARASGYKLGLLVYTLDNGYYWYNTKNTQLTW